MSRKRRNAHRKAAPAQAPVANEGVPTTDVTALGPYNYDVQYKWNSGEKFAGGAGPINLLITDYWALRARSAELFQTNGYFRGIVRRLVTNEIGTGLSLECAPDEAILGVEEDSLSPWSEDVENRFKQWADDPWLCDVSEQNTFGAIQATARQEAIVGGDVLVQLVQFQGTRLPRIKLTSGAKVQSPVGRYEMPNGNRIVYGVELDANDRQVAYWVTQPDGSSKRVAAVGTKTGRRLAWLVYGSDKRLDDVRGQPLLGIVIQSLKEIDRYRDSVQRKAVVNSTIATYVTKSQNMPGTQPLTGGAVRKGVDTGRGEVDARPRAFRAAEFIPGLQIDELQMGEDIKAFPSNGTDERFGGFEEAIVAGVAWWLQIPPEILTLSFNSNYSASQAALNEFRQYLKTASDTFGVVFCQPIYTDWLLSMALIEKVVAPDMVASWKDSGRYDVFAAWAGHEWIASMKPALKMTDEIAGYAAQIDQGMMTRARATRESNGGKFSKVVKQLRLENEALAEAKKPLLAVNEKVQVAEVTANGADSEDDAEDQPAKPASKLKLAPKKGS
jgi:lambda family phage portal protein